MEVVIIFVSVLCYWRGLETLALNRKWKFFRGEMLHIVGIIYSIFVILFCSAPKESS